MITQMRAPGDGRGSALPAAQLWAQVSVHSGSGKLRNRQDGGGLGPLHPVCLVSCCQAMTLVRTGMSVGHP